MVLRPLTFFCNRTAEMRLCTFSSKFRMAYDFQRLKMFEYLLKSETRGYSSSRLNRRCKNYKYWFYLFSNTKQGGINPFFRAAFYVSLDALHKSASNLVDFTPKEADWPRTLEKWSMIYQILCWDCIILLEQCLARNEKPVKLWVIPRRNMTSPFNESYRLINSDDKNISISRSTVMTSSELQSRVRNVIWSC